MRGAGVPRHVAFTEPLGCFPWDFAIFATQSFPSVVKDHVTLADILTVFANVAFDEEGKLALLYVC